MGISSRISRIGPPVVKSIRMATKAYLDAHLMITDPMKYAPVFAKECGVQLINFHVEVVPDAPAAAREIRKLGVHVGITLNPQTPAEAVYPALDAVDMVLVMSVHPGFGGQSFMPEVLDKVTKIKKRMRPGQRLEIDGGIDSHTILRAYEAGADWFVAGNAIFGRVDRARAIAELRAIWRRCAGGIRMRRSRRDLDEEEADCQDDEDDAGGDFGGAAEGIAEFLADADANQGHDRGDQADDGGVKEQVAPGEGVLGAEGEREADDQGVEAGGDGDGDE